MLETLIKILYDTTYFSVVYRRVSASEFGCLLEVIEELFLNLSEVLCGTELKEQVLFIFEMDVFCVDVPQSVGEVIKGLSEALLGQSVAFHKVGQSLNI